MAKYLAQVVEPVVCFKLSRLFVDFQSHTTSNSEEAVQHFAVEHSIDGLIQQHFCLAVFQHTLLRRHTGFECKPLQ
ncbi:hypothetical protein D3C87_1912940 [compost metagenome]